MFSSSSSTSSSSPLLLPSPTLRYLLSLFALFCLVLSSSSTDSAPTPSGDNDILFQYLQQLKSGPIKKSDGLGDFIGSLNGASRLRYGKRALIMRGDGEEDSAGRYSRLMHPLIRWQMMAKRGPNYAQALPAGLLDQLNGAERLRFGRK